MTLAGLAETVIEDEVGCGLFQVLFVLFIYILLRISACFTFIFMSYGNYNPGWKCLDNDTLIQAFVNGSRHQTPATTQLNVSVEYSTDFTCEEFEACGNVQFNPESSTVVTEWGLVCDKAWIASLIISVQMIGNLLSSFIAGYVADRIGRWKTAYGSLFITSLLSLLSSFSGSWQTLATIRFFIGMTSAFFESLIYVYSSEFVTRRWRGPLAGIPGWAIGGVLFGTTSMILKNWRHILIASSVVCFVGFLPSLWAPESLRWLEVKGKNEKFKRAAKKIAKINGKKLHDKYSEVFSLNNESLNIPTITENNSKKTEKKPYTIVDLSHKGYRVITLIVGFVWISLSFIYYAISFGIKALSGDFYVNLILLYAIIIPFAILPFFSSNLLGRKKSSCMFLLLASAGLFTATVFEIATDGTTRIVWTLVFVLMAEVGIEYGWSMQQVHTAEMYPTVVRGLAMNWASLMARIGGICAPFLIPRDSSSVYLWYLIMGCQGVVCCCLIFKLPETSGRAMKETFSVATLDIVVKCDIEMQEGDNMGVSDGVNLEKGHDS